MPRKMNATKDLEKCMANEDEVLGAVQRTEGLFE